MADRQKYPVFVEETTVRLLWIEADNAEAAAKEFTQYPYEYSREKTDPVDGWVVGIAPSHGAGRYDWDAVYGWGGAADEQDMHVTWHRIELDRRKRAAHAELGHPGVTDRVLNGKLWCPGCSYWVELPGGQPSGNTGSNPSAIPQHPFVPGGPGGTCGYAFDADFKHYCGLPESHEVHTGSSRSALAGGEDR